MKNVKRLVALLAALACLLSLAACGKKEEPKETNQAAVEEKQEDVFDIMESIAEENSDADVGSYVVAAEADLTWEEVEGGVSITGYTGADTAVEIPAQIAGKNVVAIGANAFASSTIAGIKLPDTVVTVGDQAFFFLGTLVELKLGAGVKTLGSGACQGCSALSNVELNNGLEVIKDNAFTMCASLEEIEIPATVTVMETGAFCMAGLRSIIIPGSVASIGTQAFTTCVNLENVVIESGLTTIGNKAFEACSALKSVEIPASVTTIEYGAFMYADNVTIYTPAGSAAEAYAQENGIPVKNN